MGGEKDCSSCTVGEPWSFYSSQRRGWPYQFSFDSQHFLWIIGWQATGPQNLSFCSLHSLPIPTQWVSQVHLSLPLRTSLLPNLPLTLIFPHIGAITSQLIPCFLNQPTHPLHVCQTSFLYKVSSKFLHATDVAGLPASWDWHLASSSRIVAFHSVPPPFLSSSFPNRPQELPPLYLWTWSSLSPCPALPLLSSHMITFSDSWSIVNNFPSPSTWIPFHFRPLFRNLSYMVLHLFPHTCLRVPWRQDLSLCV